MTGSTIDHNLRSNTSSTNVKESSSLVWWNISIAGRTDRAPRTNPIDDLVVEDLGDLYEALQRFSDPDIPRLRHDEVERLVGDE